MMASLVTISTGIFLSYLDFLVDNWIGFEDDGFATRSWIVSRSSKVCYNMYYSKSGINQTTITSGGGSSSGGCRDPYARLLHGLQPKDFASYDVLGFWKSKENQFPVLSRMAMDILSVQASSDHLDAQERKQNTSPLELPLDVEEGVFNDEVQQNEATQLTDQEIALDASSDGSLSSGERRRDK
ncbi:zinc finger BED domain-containing protein RICESLEEPER 2 [Tanacetum coccineum]